MELGEEEITALLCNSLVRSDTPERATDMVVIPLRHSPRKKSHLELQLEVWEAQVFPTQGRSSHVPTVREVQVSTSANHSGRTGRSDHGPVAQGQRNRRPGVASLPITVLKP